MNPAITIRSASASDYAALEALFAALDEHHRLARPDVFQEPVGPRREASLLDALIAGPDSAILAAQSESGDLLGLAVLIVKTIPAAGVHRARRYVELENLIVRADARRQGVGRRLIAQSRLWAKSRNASALEVAVWSFNREALALYREAGFHPTLQRLAMTLE